MTLAEFALWGLLGGFAVEGLQFVGAIRRTGGWPWRKKGEPGALPLLASVLIRLGVGASVSAAAGASGQLKTAFAAFAVGIAAPLVVEQLARQAPPTAINSVEKQQRLNANSPPEALEEGGEEVNAQ